MSIQEQKTFGGNDSRAGLLPTIKVEHRNKKPVFVIGHGSSGTSVSIRLMRKYLGVAIGTETQFFVRYQSQLPYFGDLSSEGNLRNLIREILAERFFERTGRKFGFHVTVDDVIRQMPERSYRGVLQSIMSQMAQQMNMDRWGEKTPEYVHHLPVISELFPDAQYIHIVRDGRDVALSVFGRYFGAKSLYGAAVEWCDAVMSIRDFSRSLPPERFIELKYETLLSEPRQWFAQLIDYLGIDDADGVLLDSIGDSIEDDLMLGNYDKWKSKFTAEQRQFYEQIAGPLLQAYGYEVEIDQPKKFNALQKAFWKIDNRLRIWGTLSYWQDHGYRVKVRLKDMRIRLQHGRRRS